MENGTLWVQANTNLPDGFNLFFIVDAAPELGVEAGWSGQAKVVGGSAAFGTIFSDALPYRVMVLVSAALNPSFKENFVGPQTPFTISPEWTATPFADGALQFSRQFEQDFGSLEIHKQILLPALEELEKSVKSLKSEMKILEQLRTDRTYGFARFARLHAKKSRESFLDTPTTSFYFPIVFERLRKTERELEGFFQFVLAEFEKAPEEMGRNAKSKSRFEKSIKKLVADMENVRGKLTKTQGTSKK
jgi:hypothetical protein